LERNAANVLDSSCVPLQFERLQFVPSLQKGANFGVRRAIGVNASAGSQEELDRNRNVDDTTFNRALALFGERGVVDLIGVNGYYTAVSMTLNVAQVLPEGAPLPLKPLPLK
jgi:hypothetical protein